MKRYDEPTDYGKLLEEWDRKNPPPPWWGGILPFIVVLVVVAVICAAYVDIMMLD